MPSTVIYLTDEVYSRLSKEKQRSVVVDAALRRHYDLKPR